jgi:hypothetical protein
MATVAAQGAQPGIGLTSTNLMPPLSNQGAWNVMDYGGLEVGIIQTRDRAPDVFGARVFHVDGKDRDASIDEQVPVHLIDGHRYTLTLRASADCLRNISVTACSAQRDRRNVGLDATLPLDYNSQAYSVSFVAEDTRNHPAKFEFQIGQTTGRVWLEDVNLVDDGPAVAAPNSV